MLWSFLSYSIDRELSSIGGYNLRHLLLILCISIGLYGCSSSPNTHSTKVEAENMEEDIDTDKIVALYDNYQPNPQVIDDRTLLESGDTIRDRKGEAKLLKIIQPNKTYSIDSIQFRIHDVKLIEYKPDYSLIDFYHTYTHEEAFTFVKLFVEIENTSEKGLKFAPIALLHSDANEQHTWEEDIYLESLNGLLEAKESKLGNIGFILHDDKVDTIQLNTSDVFDNQDNKLGSSEKIEISFN